jgi:hypothetical protein
LAVDLARRRAEGRALRLLEIGEEDSREIREGRRGAEIARSRGNVEDVLEGVLPWVGLAVAAFVVVAENRESTHVVSEKVRPFERSEKSVITIEGQINS